MSNDARLTDHYTTCITFQYFSAINSKLVNMYKRKCMLELHARFAALFSTCSVRVCSHGEFISFAIEQPAQQLFSSSSLVWLVHAKGLLFFFKRSYF